MCRKALCLIFAFLLSIESFGAIVSDNDGSAFVTKAEFEALKENFAGQINNYNTSIDNKIDGAIASYLNGINLTKEQQESIIMSDWADVTCYNGSWAPTYSLPSVNIGFTYIHCWPRPFETSAPTTAARTGWWNLLMTYKYNNPGIDYCYRPLITGNTETSQTTNMVWNGIAYKYMEYWHMGKTNMNTSGSWLTWLDGPIDYDYGGTLMSALRFEPSGTYNSAADILATWQPTLFWQFKQKIATSWSTLNVVIDAANDKNYVCVFNVVLAPVNGKTTFHDHIIEYDGSKKWRLSNETFTKTFRRNSNKNSTQLLAATTKTGITAFWGFLTRKGNWTFTDNYQTIYPRSTTDIYFDAGGSTQVPNVEDTTETVLPCVGMLSSDQEAKDIYQFPNKKNITFKNDNVTLEKQTLEKGFPLFYAKANYKISWEPKFNKYYKNIGSNFVEQNDKMKLYLSYGPFSDLNTTTSPVEFTTKNYTTKSSVQVIDLTGDKITFTAERDAIIYAKWVPNTTSFATDTWYSTLDLSKCNQYMYVDES